MTQSYQVGTQSVMEWVRTSHESLTVEMDIFRFL